MKALIYCRVSSDRQVNEGHGLDGQEKRCRDYAHSRDYHVVAVFKEEGISGGLIERPQMQRLLEKLEEYKTAPEKTVVIIDDIKRLARDVVGHFILKTAIASRNGVLASPSLRFEESPEGKFVETVLAGAAELERNQNKQQVVNRMKARAESGHWPFCLPPGLINSKNPLHGKVAGPHEPLASIFKTAIEGFRDRTLLTQQDVADSIRKEYQLHGVNRKISLNGAQHILTEILYTGYVEYPKWGITRRKGVHEGFITLETYEEVQRILADRTKPKIRRDSNPDFPLRGLVVCPACHKPYTGSYNTGHRGQRYPNYFCNHEDCPQRYKIIHRKDMETAFIDYLQTVKLGKTVLDLATAILQAVWDQKQAQVVDSQRDYKKRLQDIGDDIGTVTTRIKQTTNEKLIRIYEDELLKLQEQKDGMDAAPAPSRYTKEQFGTATNTVMGVLKDPASTWQNGDLNDRFAVYFMHFDQKPIYDRNMGFGTAPLAQSVELIHSLGSEKTSSVEMPSNELGSKLSFIIHLQA